MNRRDRIVNIGLVALAGAAWLGLGYVFLNHYPTESVTALLTGALLLGAAVGLTLAPLFWLAGFVRANRIAYRGSWWRAGRRGALSGLVAVLFVLMRGQDFFSVPLAIFVIAMAVLVELTLSLRA